MSEGELAELQIPPLAGAILAPVPPLGQALMNLSDLLFETHDKHGMTEGMYIKLQNAAKALYEAKRLVPPPPPPSLHSVRAPERLDELRSLLVDLQEDYTEQLTQATTRIDKLEHDCDFQYKCVGALESVCFSAGIPDHKLLAAYDRAGVKHRVLVEREKLKRKREEEDAGFDIIRIPTSDEDDEDDEKGGN